MKLGQIVCKGLTSLIRTDDFHYVYVDLLDDFDFFAFYRLMSSQQKEIIIDDRNNQLTKELYEILKNKLNVKYWITDKNFVENRLCRYVITDDFCPALDDNCRGISIEFKNWFYLGYFPDKIMEEVYRRSLIFEQLFELNDFKSLEYVHYHQFIAPEEVKFHSKFGKLDSMSSDIAVRYALINHAFDKKFGILIEPELKDVDYFLERSSLPFLKRHITSLNLRLLRSFAN